MLVGHSQGGMVAAELAGELNRDHEFTVTHVVTAGSPIGLSPVPSSISVLSLENRGDVVPELDGSDNPARSGWLTARVDQGPPDALKRHSMNSYVAGAADFDADRRSGRQRLANPVPPATSMRPPCTPPSSGSDAADPWSTVAQSSFVRHDHEMLGLMQDFPLTIEAILRHGERLYGAKTVVTQRGRGQRADHAGRGRRPVSAGGRRAGRLGRQPGRPGRLVRLEHRQPHRALLRRAVLRPGAAHHEHPAVRRSAGLHRRTCRGRGRLRRPIAAAVARPVPAEAQHGQARGGHRRRFAQRVPRRSPAGPAGRTWSGRSSTSAEWSPTRTPPPAICYTTGTTGNPKGVLYSHRSSYLHSLATQTPATFAMAETDTVLPVVPMFHAMAWGIPYAAVMAGSDLVMPGPQMTPAALLDADGIGEGDAHRRRADHLDGHAAAVGRARPVQPAAHHLRRFGRAQGAVGRLAEEDRATDHPGLGHDRAVPAGHRLLDPVGVRRRRTGGAGRRPGHRRHSADRGRAADRRFRDPGRTALGQRGGRRTRGVADPGSRASTTAPTSRASSSPTTAGCGPATWPRSRSWATCGWSTGPRT